MIGLAVQKLLLPLAWAVPEKISLQVFCVIKHFQGLDCPPGNRDDMNPSVGISLIFSVRQMVCPFKHGFPPSLWYTFRRSRGKTMHYVYIVQCTDQTLYTGWTTDIKKRLTAHNEGRGAKRTKGRGPVVLMYLEIFEDKGAALRREMAIKKLTRQQKFQLIEEARLNCPLWAAKPSLGQFV